MKAFLFLILLTACYPKSYEMEELSKDVLKSKGEGIEIEVKPIPKTTMRPL